MSLLHLRLEDICEANLTRLVDDGVSESRILEFKESLSLVSDQEKREFLCDVSAMANTEGGEILYGIKESDGNASEVVGLRNFIADDAIGQIENLIRDAVQPRIIGLGHQIVPLQNGTRVLILRVPKSLSSPHMVRHKGITRFCGRNSNGKYDLDVHELRSAFLSNETFADRIKAFRMERINRLLSGASAVPLQGSNLVVLHIMPVGGVRGDRKFSSQELKAVERRFHFPPLWSAGWGSQVNFEGMVVTNGNSGNAASSYVQLFRNGFIEAVNSSMLTASSSNRGGSIKDLRPGTIEKEVIDGVKAYAQGLKHLGLQTPWVLSLTLLNIRHYVIPMDSSAWMMEIRPVDRDHLILDEILVESFEEDWGRTLRPAFDQMWNACGMPGSLNYNPAGDWTFRRR